MNWFGGTEELSKVIDIADTSLKGVGNWIDEQQFTDEERSKVNAEIIGLHSEFVRMAYDTNSIRSVTRRWLAWLITLWVLVMASAAIVGAITGNENLAATIIDISKSFWLGEAFVAVIAFYFGSHLIKR